MSETKQLTIHNPWGDLTIQIVHGHVIQIALDGKPIFSGSEEESEQIAQFIVEHFKREE